MSNTKQIEKSLKKLILNDDRAFVAMLSGEWGIGKTYFWKKFTKEYLKDKSVVYISLFGKNSLADIETDIVTKLYKYNKSLKKYTKHLDTVGNMASKAMGLPINVSIGSLLSLFTSNDFKNIVICFDDFERLSDKVSLKDVMGLISQFKEQKECKVIMILNERELDKLSDIDGKKHDEIFTLYKEKVVDYNFHYQPSQEELFEAIAEDIVEITFCKHQAIYDFFEKIELKNIRIMKQALYLLKQFSFLVSKGYDEKVIDEFVEIALNLFVFKAKSNYIYSEFNDFRSYIPYDEQIYNSKIYGDKETEIVKDSKHESNLTYYYSDNQQFSQEYHSRNKDIIEKNIYTFMDTHKINKDKLQHLLNENNQRLSWYDTRNEISDMNMRFFTDFSTTNSELAKQLFKLINKYKEDMHRLSHYSAYKPFINNIKKFAPEISTEELEIEIAKKCLDFYIVSPDHDKYGPLEESSEITLIFSHYSWAEEYYNTQKSEELAIQPNNILQLIEEILKIKYLPEDIAYKLAHISATNYESLIKENSDLVQPLVRFLKMSDSKDVRMNIIKALKSLKAQSDDYAWKVNQIVKNANIDLEEGK